MAVSVEAVKILREKTGAGMMDCKKALDKANGDIEKAITYLREQGMLAASKKSSRTTKEGVIHAYTHLGSRIGAMVEVNCETDFVARNETFQALVHDLAMQVAASRPLAVDREHIAPAIIERELEIYRAQARNERKPEHLIERIIQGKLDKFYQDNCLLEQPFIRDTDKTVKELITEAVAKLGENIIIRRFVRFELGGD